MGTADGKCVLNPRLEGWLAACELYGIPHERRPELIEAARAIFEAVQERQHERGLHLRDPRELGAPPPPD